MPLIERDCFASLVSYVNEANIGRKFENMDLIISLFMRSRFIKSESMQDSC